MFHPAFWQEQNNHLKQEQFEEQLYYALNTTNMEIVEPDSQDSTVTHPLIFKTILPPFRIGNQFFKGIAFSNACDLLCSEIPDLNALFLIIADTQHMGLSPSHKVDGIFGHYPHPERQSHYEKHFPKTTKPKWIPFQSADWVNSDFFRPLGQPEELASPFEKTIDLLCLDPAHPASNILVLAEGLKAYRQEYPETPIQLHWYFNGSKNLAETMPSFTQQSNTSHDENHNPSHNHSFETIYRELEELLITPQDYIVFHPETPDADQRLHLYQQSRIVTSAMVFGPKHPYLTEAACCNTPIFWLERYHKPLLQKTKTATPFPSMCGLASSYEPEIWAKRLNELWLAVQQTYPNTLSPRISLLKVSGRHQVLKQCLSNFNLYTSRLPQLFNEGPDFFKSHFAHQHILLDMAILNDYQMDLLTWLQQDHAGTFSFVSEVSGQPETIQLIQGQLNHLKKQFRKWL
jgi:hypothetical protein